MALTARETELVGIHRPRYYDRAVQHASMYGIPGVDGVIQQDGDLLYLTGITADGTARYSSPASGHHTTKTFDPGLYASAQQRFDTAANTAAQGLNIDTSFMGGIDTSFMGGQTPPAPARALSNPFDLMAAKADALRTPEQQDRYNQAVRNTVFANEAFEQQRDAFLNDGGPEPTFSPSMQVAQDQLKNEDGFYAPRPDATPRPTPAPPPGYVGPGTGGGTGVIPGYPGGGDIGDPFDPPVGPPSGDFSDYESPFGPGGSHAPTFDWTPPPPPPPPDISVPDVTPPPQSLTAVNQWFGSQWNPATNEFETGAGNPTNEDFYSRQFNRMTGLRDQMRDQQNQARGNWNAWQRQQNSSASALPAIDWSKYDALANRDVQPVQGAADDGMYRYSRHSDIVPGMTNREIVQRFSPNDANLGRLIDADQAIGGTTFNQGQFLGKASSVDNLNAWLGKQGFDAARQSAFNDMFNKMWTRDDLTTPVGGGPTAAPGYALPVPGMGG